MLGYYLLTAILGSICGYLLYLKTIQPNKKGESHGRIRGHQKPGNREPERNS
jgi:hypothetical protein